MDGDRIGLNINEEYVYVTMDELLSASINNNEYVIKSEVMELYITLQKNGGQGRGLDKTVNV